MSKKWSTFGPLNFFIFRYVEGGVLGNNNISIKKCRTTFLWVLNLGQVGKLPQRFSKSFFHKLPFTIFISISAKFGTRRCTLGYLFPRAKAPFTDPKVRSKKLWHKDICLALTSMDQYLIQGVFTWHWQNHGFASASWTRPRATVRKRFAEQKPLTGTEIIDKLICIFCDHMIPYVHNFRYLKLSDSTCHWPFFRFSLF